MRALPPDLDVDATGRELLEFWRERGLPPPGPPPSPPPPGAASFFVDPLPAAGGLSRGTLERLVVADVASRYLRLRGRPVRDLLVLSGRSPTPELDAEMDQYSLWFGRHARRSLAELDMPGLQKRALEAWAGAGLLRAISGLFLACPVCAELQTPETVVYSEEERTIHLVRVPLAGRDPPLSAIVWTDAAWKLLGAEAVLLHPDRPYVRAEFRRRGRSEEILVARSALERFALWLPNGEIKVLEERPGSQWAGAQIEPPLGASAPERLSTDSPVGTLVARTEVDDEGTGLVLLVPAHAPADAAVARELRLGATPVVGIDGRITDQPRTKYAGLPLDTGEACIVRDMVDLGRRFHELRVRKGIPRCGGCGNELYWRPARAWCLLPEEVPTTTREGFGKLLPGERWPEPSAGVPWPLTGAGPSTPSAPTLGECPACGRLSARPGPERCACGAGAPEPVARPLLPVLLSALGVAGGLAPWPTGGSLWFVLPERRRVPWVIHRLLALEGLGARPGELHATVLAAGPPEGSAEGLALAPPTDAIRAALLRQAARCPPRQSLAEAIVQESHRLRRVWRRASELLALMISDGYRPDGLAITGRLEELLPEDRTFLGAFEVMRRDVLGLYERGEWARGYDRLASFIDRDFRQEYVPIVADRTLLPAGAPGRLALDHLLAHVLPRICELAGPVTPQVAEGVHRALLGDRASVFSGTFSPLVEPLLDEGASARLAEWGDLVRAVRAGRRRLGWPARGRIPSVVLVPRSEEEGGRLAAVAPLLARALGAEKVLVHPPSQPWPGHRLEARPNLEAIRRAFPVYHRRIVSVLAQMDGRRMQEAARTGTLAVALEGQPALKIPPSLLEVVESLPEGFSPIPWRRGEAYLERSPDLPLPAPARPGLSVALRRVRRELRRRLDRLPRGSPRPSKAFLWAEGPFAEELARGAEEIARGLEPTAVLVAPSPGLFVAEETTQARARRGVHFRVWLPGCPKPERAHGRARRRRSLRRLRLAAPQIWDLPSAVDYLDESELQKSQGVAAWSEELAARGALRTMGPAKLAAAWDRGIRSTSDLVSVPTEVLVGLPGVGPILAEHLVRELAPERPLAPLAPLFEPTPFEPDPPPAEDPVHVPLRNPPRVELAPKVLGRSPEPAAVSAPVAAPTPGPVPLPTPSALPPAPPTGAAPVVEALLPPAGPTPPPAGRLVVHTGPARDAAWEEFRGALAGGSRGLWVGRFLPRALQSTPGAAVEYLWLAGTDRPNAVRPADLPGIRERIERAVREGGVRAVLLEESEYLAALAGAPAVVELLARLSSMASERGVRIWAPVDPGIFPGDPAQLAPYAV